MEERWNQDDRLYLQARLENIEAYLYVSIAGFRIHARVPAWDRFFLGLRAVGGSLFAHFYMPQGRATSATGSSCLSRGRPCEQNPYRSRDIQASNLVL